MENEGVHKEVCSDNQTSLSMVCGLGRPRQRVELNKPKIGLAQSEVLLHRRKVEGGMEMEIMGDAEIRLEQLQMSEWAMRRNTNGVETLKIKMKRARPLAGIQGKQRFQKI